MRTLPRARVAAFAVTVVAGVAASALLSGARAEPGPGSTTAARHQVSAQPAVPVANVPAAPGATIPPPPGPNNDYGIQFDPISTRVRKAKVAFALPPLTFRSYLLVCFTTSTSSSPCPGHDLSKYPTLPFPYTWDVAFADNWVASYTGGRLHYGVFPPVRVSMLAFGAIPVTATAHLVQTVHHGLYDPMKLLAPLDISPIPPGQHVPGFGPAPKYSTGLTFFSYKAIVKGTVDIRLSDVTVDRIPLAVGPDCHTAEPANLTLSAPAGYYPQNVPPNKLKGKPGEFQPLGAGGPGGYLQGSAAVPAFTGCHHGAENLDRLITGMISGPGNPVNAYSNHGLQSWCLEPIAHCSKQASAQQRRIRTLVTPAAVRAALAHPGTLARLGSYRQPVAGASVVGSGSQTR